MRSLVVVGILEVYHLQTLFPLLAHLAQTHCRANINEAPWLTIWKTNQTRPISSPYFQANAETRDNHIEDPALFFQSTAQPLKRESSPPLFQNWETHKFPCYVVVLQSFKKVGRAAFRTDPPISPPGRLLSLKLTRGQEAIKKSQLLLNCSTPTSGDGVIPMSKMIVFEVARMLSLNLYQSRNWRLKRFAQPLTW